MTQSELRVGHGFDVHRFADEPMKNATIRLGGVTIDSERELLAHSDGDVLIHAVCDALLGAAGLGDIGQHFPDTDNTYQNIDSRQLLRQVVSQLKLLGYGLQNLDITLVAQAPKLLPFKQQIKVNLGQDLECDSSRLNIKATTTEGLGYTGRKEGIACHAVVLIVKS